MSKAFLADLEQAPLPQDLRRRLRESPHAIFRYVNRTWAAAVCRVFADEIPHVPAVRLHGDAHVEQYAVTATARGLDDFDDSATGPAFIDLVRFLGSLELVAYQRGWEEAPRAAATAFLDGYRHALADPAYMPPEPRVVARLRARRELSPEEFLSWSESLMRPMPPDEQADFNEGWASFTSYARLANRFVTADQLRVKRVGWLQLGIGSALTRKLLVRVEGASSAADDDLVLEGKELLTLSRVSCLSVPSSGELFRVVEGITQVGRLRHNVLAVVPIIQEDRPEARGWWVKDWARSYRELEIADLESPQDLFDVAHDAGAQLGSANLPDVDDGLAPQKRLMEAEALARLEPEVRAVAHALAEATVEAWRTFTQQP